MKKIFALLILVFILFNAGHAGAQLFSGDADSTLPKGEFGVRAGVNMQSISGQTWDNSYSTGFSGGAWARMHKNKIGVRAEIAVSTFRLNAATRDSGGHQYYAISDSVGNRGTFSATSLDIPVLLEITIVPKLLVQAGVQYSNLLSLSNVSSISGSYKDLFKQGEFSALIGVEVTLPLNLSVGARYRYGLSNINNTVVSDISEAWKTNAFQLYACYKISKGR